MRVLVTGAAGFLGSTLVSSGPAGLDVRGTCRADVELSDAAAVDALFDEQRPDVVVHTAYGTADGRRDILDATTNVAGACRSSGAALVHLSSDLVFEGEGAPYAESAPTAPIVDYGRWKVAAEATVRAAVADATIVRTSLIVGTDPLDPRCAWIADGLRRGDPVRLFVDELRCPIGVDDLATSVWELVAMPRQARAGVWHVVGPECLSRYALGLLVALHAGLDATAIEPVLASSSPTPRPRDVRLEASPGRRLLHRARPVSALLAPARPAPDP